MGCTACEETREREGTRGGGGFPITLGIQNTLFAKDRDLSTRTKELGVVVKKGVDLISWERGECLVRRCGVGPRSTEKTPRFDEEACASNAFNKRVTLPVFHCFLFFEDVARALKQHLSNVGGHNNVSLISVAAPAVSRLKH